MGSRWAPWEAALVDEFWARHGAAWDGWAVVLPSRSAAAIAAKARDMGLDGPGAWTDGDLSLLSRLLMAFSRRTGRRPRAVASMAYRLMRYGEADR